MQLGRDDVLKLVATDLDGTLLHSDGSVTERTRRALTLVEDLGVTVLFVTGRPLRWTEEVFEHVGPHGLAVVSNGALVWDVAGDRVRLTRTIPVEVGRDVCAAIRTAVPGCAFAVETLDGIALEPGFVERHPVPDGARRGPISDILTTPPLKILARHEDLQPQDFWDRAADVVGDAAVITWSSTSSLLEISAAGVTKATTMQLLCAERGIGPDDVVAFGDMPNDLPMLAWAGTSYAMANAHPTVREAADHVAPSNDDDGVAVVLEELFGL